MEGAALSAPKLWPLCPMSQINRETEPGRKHPAHPPLIERHNEPVIVYATICSEGRKRIFAFSDSAAVIVDAWQEAKSWLVGRYVIMPDHIHLFCAPNTFPAKPLTQWVQYWKSEASRHWPRPKEQPIWQRDAWDTQLRRLESYDSKWEYVINNPVRAGLVKNASDWPFQGEINVLL
jgi:putative transposase